MRYCLHKVFRASSFQRLCYLASCWNKFIYNCIKDKWTKELYKITNTANYMFIWKCLSQWLTNLNTSSMNPNLLTFLTLLLLKWLCHLFNHLYQKSWNIVYLFPLLLYTLNKWSLVSVDFISEFFHCLRLKSGLHSSLFWIFW